MRMIFRSVWNFCERFNVDPGPMAPWVFGGMIGRMPHKKP